MRFIVALAAPLVVTGVPRRLHSTDSEEESVSLSGSKSEMKDEEQEKFFRRSEALDKFFKKGLDRDAAVYVGKDYFKKALQRAAEMNAAYREGYLRAFDRVVSQVYDDCMKSESEHRYKRVYDVKAQKEFKQGYGFFSNSGAASNSEYLSQIKSCQEHAARWAHRAARQNAKEDSLDHAEVQEALSANVDIDAGSHHSSSGHLSGDIDASHEAEVFSHDEKSESASALQSDAESRAESMLAKIRKGQNSGYRFRGHGGFEYNEGVNNVERFAEEESYHKGAHEGQSRGHYNRAEAANSAAASEWFSESRANTNAQYDAGAEESMQEEDESAFAYGHSSKSNTEMFSEDEEKYQSCSGSESKSYSKKCSRSS